MARKSIMQSPAGVWVLAVAVMVSLLFSSQPAASAEAGISLIPYPLWVILCVLIGESSYFSSDWAGTLERQAAIERFCPKFWRVMDRAIRLRRFWTGWRSEKAELNTRMAEKLVAHSFLQKKAWGFATTGGGRHLRQRLQGTTDLLKSHIISGLASGAMWLVGGRLAVILYLRAAGGRRRHFVLTRLSLSVIWMEAHGRLWWEQIETFCLFLLVLKLIHFIILSIGY